MQIRVPKQAENEKCIILQLHGSKGGHRGGGLCKRDTLLRCFLTSHFEGQMRQESNRRQPPTFLHKFPFTPTPKCARRPSEKHILTNCPFFSMPSQKAPKSGNVLLARTPCTFLSGKWTIFGLWPRLADSCPKIHRYSDETSGEDLGGEMQSAKKNK